MTSMENEIQDARDDVANALGYIVPPKHKSLRELIRELVHKMQDSEVNRDDLSCVDHGCDDCHSLRLALSSWD